MKKEYLLQCAVPENIHTHLTERIGISWGVGGSVSTKNLKKAGGGGVLQKNPSVGEVWIFSGNTQLQTALLR